MAYVSKKSVFNNKTILKILDYYKNLWALSHASAVLHWDLETFMPTKGVGARGQALGRLATIRQKMFLDQGFVSLIYQARDKTNLTDQEKAVIRILLRSLKYYQKLPPKFVESFENLTNQATVVWRKAKEKNEYNLFEPYLIRIFEMNKKAADYLGYKDSPYDALLDQFEEGLTSNSVSQFFSKIKQPLLQLKSSVLKSPKYLRAHPLEGAKYDKEKMEILNDKVLKFLWEDMGRFRLDESSHPFTTSFANTDTRITTWYHSKDFGRSLLATVHEFGHALYELQSADELEMTPASGGSSLVIHESQSRFWENFVGRSKEFIGKFIVDMRQVTGDKSLAEKDVHMYFNKVSPGMLRVEADEVTYHFHIMLRFEIEKEIIEGKLKVKDIKEIWNAKMKEYLELVPKSDSDGLLQDIHWSGGMVGYFPTYSLGTFLGAQWEKEMNLEFRINNKLRSKNLEFVKNWLKANIHKYGSTYTLGELLQKNDMEFDPTVNINYLKQKYSKIYGF